MRSGIACLAAAALALAAGAAPLAAQGFPVIGTRQFGGGSAKLVVTGAFTISEDIPINVQASFADGEVTWIQYGASGSGTPNALITYGDTKEIGITVGRGKLIATGGIQPGEPSACTGRVAVAAKTISGRYTCKGIASFDAATGRMGTVDVDIVFTATS